jgi:hypothetical protein
VIRVATGVLPDLDKIAEQLSAWSYQECRAAGSKSASWPPTEVGTVWPHGGASRFVSID